jgi:hypothetical protein
MSLKASTWAWNQKVSPPLKLVLLAFANFADDAGQCWPSRSRLSELTGFNPRQVQRILKKLRAGGFILPIAYAAGGRNKSTVYQMTFEKGDITDSLLEQKGDITDSLSDDKGRQIEHKRETNRAQKGDTGVSPTYINRNRTVSKKREGTSHFVPDNFAVTEEMRVWACEKVAGIDVDLETESFRNWEFKTARTDWIRAWRGWMIRAQDRKEQNYGNGNGSGHRRGTDGGEERKLRRGQIAYDPILQAKMEEEDRRWREAQIIEKS